MSLVVRRGTICLGGSDRRAPDRRAGPRRAVRRLVTILRREAAAGVSAALLHLADACCPADVAVPPVLPAGKEPRNFGLHRVKPRGRPPAHRHHPAAAECCAQADHPPDQGVNAPYRSPNRAGPRRPHWSTPERDPERKPLCVKGLRRSFSRRVRCPSGPVAFAVILGPWPSSRPSVAVVLPHLQVVRPRFAAGAPPGPAAAPTAGWQRSRNGYLCPGQRQAQALGC